MVLNKEILDSVGFRYPFLVSWLGLAFSAVATHALQFAGYLKLKHKDTVTFQFWIRRCLPVGICHAATLCFGNALYLHMGLAMIQFLKSFTPIDTAVISYFILGKKETKAQCASLALICIGTAIAASGDMSLTATGLLLAVCGSLSEAVRLAMTDLLLSGHKMDVLESTYFLAPAGAACLFLTGAVLEGPTILARGDLSKLAEHPLTFALAATLGFGVQLLTTAVIKAAGGTGLKVLGQVRNSIPVLCGALVYREPIGAQSVAGYLLSLAAFSSYTYLKTRATTPSPVPDAAGKEHELEPLRRGGEV